MTTAEATGRNVDPDEISHFSALAADWWDLRGPGRTLHEINPCRLEFITEHAALAGKSVLDIGCGGGVLTESLARAGAHAHGIDASAALIEAARQHAAGEGLSIQYTPVTAEAFAQVAPGAYQIITCMELLEHVPDPGSLLAACRALLAPEGDLFLSTLNRTPKAWGTAVLGAEHLLGLLPKGTHDYRRFIRPSELAQWLRAEGFEVQHLSGMRYLPLSRRAERTRDVSVNYLLHARLRA